jgi:hypothetical protein
VGVTVDGRRDILGLWVGTGGEGAKYWLQVLTEIKNRGTDDVCIVVCDGLKGLPDAKHRSVLDHPSAPIALSLRSRSALPPSSMVGAGSMGSRLMTCRT